MHFSFYGLPTRDVGGVKTKIRNEETSESTHLESYIDVRVYTLFEELACSIRTF